MAETAEQRRSVPIERSTGRTRGEFDFEVDRFVVYREFEVTDLDGRGKRVSVAREWRKQ